MHPYNIAISPPTQRSYPLIFRFFRVSFHLHLRNQGKECFRFQTYLRTTEKQLIITFLTVQVDPTQNLTFNLKLTDDERQARSNLQLPYMYHEKKTSEVTVHPSGEGKVFYQPDEADDFDDEDPDDDLDI